MATSRDRDPDRDGGRDLARGDDCAVDGNNVINFAEAHAAGGVPLSGTVTGLRPTAPSR